MKKCVGCGSLLQNEDENLVGYVQNLEMDYCQRCFKMIHYGIHDKTIEKIDNELTLQQLNNIHGQFVWIIDIFDFDSSLNSVFKEFYQNKSCLVVLNKCDLLPNDVNYQAIGKYVLKYLNKLHIKTIGVITRGVNNDFIDVFNSFIDTNSPMIMTGLANVGKSTIINQLLDKQLVTVNPYPATTININEITSDKYHLFDTVGIVNVNSFAFHLNEKKLKYCLPNKQIKPVIFQLKENQSFALGGLVRFDIFTKQKCSCIFYFNNMLNIHRGKLENADKLWKFNYNKDLKPISDSCDDYDKMKKYHYINKGKNSYSIAGLGFMTVVCDNCEVEIYCDPSITILQKEAMI